MKKEKEQNGAVFRTDGDWQFNARIDNQRSSFELHAVSYKKAADLLVGKIIEDKGPLDWVISSIVFMYRHYLELQIKHIIRILRFLSKEERKPQPMHHNLAQLWDECKRLFLDKHVKEIKETADGRLIHVIINEFHKHDAGSYAFRYPIDTQGKTTLTGLKQIDIRHLHEIMKKTENTLDYIAHKLEQQLEYKTEFEAEMRAEYEADMRAAYEADMRAAYEADMRAACEADMRAAYEAEMRAACEADMRAAYEADMRANQCDD